MGDFTAGRREAEYFDGTDTYRKVQGQTFTKITEMMERKSKRRIRILVAGLMVLTLFLSSCGQ